MDAEHTHDWRPLYDAPRGRTSEGDYAVLELDREVGCECGATGTRDDTGRVWTYRKPDGALRRQLAAQWNAWNSRRAATLEGPAAGGAP